MYDVNDILKQLNDGVEAEAIAQQMTDALNQAIAQKNEADAKQKAANDKLMVAQGIADGINAFINTFYPTLDEKLSGQDVIDLIEGVQELKQTLAPLKAAFDGLKQAKPAVKPAATKPDNADALSDFISSMGW